MGIINWLYTNSTKNLRVKIVHPGGHAELHDRPVLVADIIRRNPKCCVAHPHVFKQPWAIVQPDTTLMPGQKVYVVPISTVRKLQKLSIKKSLSSGQEARDGQILKQDGEEEEDADSDTSTCCSFEDTDGTCMKSFKGENTSENNKSCFTCGLERPKRKAGSIREESGLPSCSEQRNRKNGGSPKKLITSLDYWHPSLHSIVEERSVHQE